MINNKLANLFIREQELLKEVNDVRSQIGSLSNEIPDEDVIETKSSVTPDDKEMGRWLRKRKNNQIKKETRKMIQRGEITKIPSGWTAVYELYHRNELVYVGITKNIEERIKVHRKDKEFTSHKIVNVFRDRFLAMKHEHDLIETHQPKYNKSIYS